MSGLDLDALLADLGDPTPDGHRAGMVALAGRPNVGKSTLLNALVGEKVAIVSQVPGTTRNAIRGIVTREDAQLVLLDTPGVATPRTLLGQRLNDLVEASWAAVDVVAFLADVADGVGAGDRMLAERVAATGAPVVVVATKEDLLRDPHRMIPQLAELDELLDPVEVVPVSAVTGTNLDTLLDVLVAQLPEGPRLLPPGTVTDQAESALVAELVREQLLVRLRQEVPHSVAVVVDQIDPPREDGLVAVHASVHVERDSQKGIVIGRRGATIRDVGTAARPAIEALLGARIHLDLRVRVSRNWQKDPKQLGRLGY